MLGRPVPGAVHIVEDGESFRQSVVPVSDYQQRAGKRPMQAFVEALRSQPLRPGHSQPPPCFRQFQFGFLLADKRTCLAYTDGTLACSSCQTRMHLPNPALAGFLPSPSTKARAPPHPSVLSQITTESLIRKRDRTRVSLSVPPAVLSFAGLIESPTLGNVRP